MPNLKIPKESLEGPKKLPIGIVDVRLDGFSPDWSQKKDSYNLMPNMRIINNPDYHDRKVNDWLNSRAGWVMRDFCHCFGIQLAGPDDDPEFPGEFTPSGEADPKKWNYQGPLLGRTGKLELAEADGGKYVNIKRYLCQVPGCTVKHSENLIRS